VSFLFWSLLQTIDINFNTAPLVFHIFFMARLPLVGQDLLIIEASRSHSNTLNSSGRVISPSRRPVPDNRQRSEETGIHAPGEIRTRIPRKRTTAESRLRPRASFQYCPCKNSGTFLACIVSVLCCQQPFSCVISHRVTCVQIAIVFKLVAPKISILRWM